MANKDILMKLIDDVTKCNDCDVDKLADCIIRDGWVKLPCKVGDMDFCGVLCNYAEGLIDKTKAETVKEFAERLIEKSWETGTVHGIVRVVEVGQIKNILKELVGDK